MGTTLDTPPPFLEKRARHAASNLPLSDRVESFDLVELGLSESDAQYEANRCLNCSMCGHCMFELNQCCHETGSRLL
jgi:hypothetical protein